MTDTLRTDELRFERLLPAGIETVWAYLIDPDLRALWFMGGPTEPRAGGRIGLTMAHDNLSDGVSPVPERYAPYMGTAWSERIVRIEPPRLLVITWEDGAAGTVTFALEPVGDATRLTLIHAGLRGRDDAVNFGGGWLSHLAVLEHRLAGTRVESFWALHAAAEARVAAALDDA